VGHGSLLAGRYRLEERVRTGPDGSLWRAVDETLERPVSVRVVRPGHRNTADVVDAARRAALVEDARLVRVLDVGESHGSAYIVAEHLIGRTMEELLARGPLPAEVVRRLIGEAAQALDRASARGLHHLRLSPASLVITPDGRIKVLGTAVEAALAGVEQDEDPLGADRADAIGLVRVLYTGLTGRWPGPLDGPLGTAPKVTGRVTPPGDLVAGIPNDLDTLCAVTLGPHDDGPQSPGDLAAQLAPWAQPAPITNPGGLAIGPTRPTRASSERTASAAMAAGAPVGAGSAAGPGTGSAVGSGRSGAAPSPPTLLPRDPHPTGGRSSGRGLVSAGSPAGAAPSGVAPSGVAPSGVAPSGVAPAGVAPSGVAPSGVAPSGATAPGVARRSGSDPSPVVPPTTRSGPASSTRAAGHRSDPDGPGPSDWSLLAPPPDEPPGTEPLGPFIPPAPLSRPSRSQARLVLALVAGLVVLGLVLAVFSLRGLRDAGSLVTTGPVVPTTAATTSTSAAPAAPPASASGSTSGSVSATPSDSASATPEISGIEALDPQGDGSENNAQATNAIDRDPATSWRSDRYQTANFGGLKKGVGLYLTISGAQVSKVTVSMPGTGGTVELRTPGSAGAGNVDAATVIATAQAQNGTAVLTPTQPVTADALLLWFTALPQQSTGEYRLVVSEITVS
jgi:hypothetical protein